MRLTDSDSILVKALFSQAVGLAGGSTAVGALLGIARQRVEQLCSTDCTDVPALKHILPVEQFIREPVVTGYLSRKIMGAGESNDLHKETDEAIIALSEIKRLLRSDAPMAEIQAAASKARREVEDIIHAAGGVA